VQNGGGSIVARPHPKRTMGEHPGGARSDALLRKPPAAGVAFIEN
jgi:hypothetical protein